MSKEELRQFDEQHMSTWDTHDPDAFVAQFADDFLWHDWTLREPIRTREVARQFFSSWIAAFPDLMTVSATRVIGDDAIATEVEWTGTNTGPMRMGWYRNASHEQDGAGPWQLLRAHQGRQDRRDAQSPRCGRTRRAAGSHAGRQARIHTVLNRPLFTA